MTGSVWLPQHGVSLCGKRKKIGGERREGDIEKGGNFGIYPTVDLRTIAWYVAGPAEVLGQGGGKVMLEEGCGAWEV